LLWYGLFPISTMNPSIANAGPTFVANNVDPYSYLPNCQPFAISNGNQVPCQFHKLSAKRLWWNGTSM
jgi:hypothetical protein